MTFLALYAIGKVQAHEIDDFVDQWHNQKNPRESLREFLGFTQPEFVRWLSDPQSLLDILKQRQKAWH